MSEAKKLTGTHVLAMFVGGFGIIIGVNIFYGGQRRQDISGSGSVLQLRR